MQRIVLAAALVAGSVATAKAETVWIGNGFVDFVSGPASCTSTFVVGDFFRLVYRPRGGPLGNGIDSHLAAVGSRASVVMQVAAEDFQVGNNYAPLSVGSTVSIGTVPGGGITVWQQTPAALSAGTPTVKIRGRFSNFFRISGCFVELRGNLARR